MDFGSFLDLDPPPRTYFSTLLPAAVDIPPAPSTTAKKSNICLSREVRGLGHAHGRERKSGMGVTFLPSHCRKGVEWHVNRHEIVGLVGIAPPD
jgi:hypothetical protein